SNVQLTMSSATENASIYYTIDGSYPTKDSTLYSGPITLTVNQYIREIAIRDGMEDSFVAQGQYMISQAPGNGTGPVTPPVPSETPEEITPSEIQKIDKIAAVDGVVRLEVISG